MRTLKLILFTIIVGAAFTSATAESSQLFTNSQLSSSLSGTTGSGLNFVELPKSAIYGFLGAGFLVITVLRRRKHIHRVQKPRIH